MKKVAVFDIDGTIFRSSLLIELVNELIKSGVFPESARDVYRKEHTSWLKREGNYSDYINKVVESFSQNIKGIHYSKVADAAENVFFDKNKQTYKFTRNLIKKLKKKNYYLLAISHSPKLALDDFCNNLGFDKVYGSFYEIGPQDMFTGDAADFHLIANKANIVKRVIEQENLTLDGSIGVGDTESDIPFLEMVENSICFNPNEKLYRYARRMGWKTIVERKDVVYDIE